MTTRLVQMLGMFACIILFVGCSEHYGTKIKEGADLGGAISQQDAQAGAREWLAGYLKDPGSAQYQWEPITPMWVVMQPTAFHPRIYGYGLKGMVNGKNSYGGYVGFTAFRFFFQNGRVVQVAQWEPKGQAYWQVYPYEKQFDDPAAPMEEMRRMNVDQYLRR